MLGGGYIVPDEVGERSIRRSLMWLLHGSGVLGCVGPAVLLGFYGQISEWPIAAWAIAIVGFVAINIAYHLEANTLTRGMEPADLRMELIDALKRQAEAFPACYLWLVLLMAPLAVAGAMFWQVDSPSIINYAVATAGIACFITGAIQAVHGLTAPSLKSLAFAP
jgi:hypothetical protein